VSEVTVRSLIRIALERPIRAQFIESIYDLSRFKILSSHSLLLLIRERPCFLNYCE
jgi:hypothetical protein